jgi:hypothetical protein
MYLQKKHLPGMRFTIVLAGSEKSQLATSKIQKEGRKGEEGRTC